MSRNHNHGLPLIVVVSPGYNCSNNIRYWSNSLRVQSYTNWKVYAIDDASEDDTFFKLSEVAKADNRFKVLRNESHLYQLGNWNSIIRSLNDDVIVVRLDLDDFLGNKYVFESIIKENLYRGANVFSITEFTLSAYYQNNRSSRWYSKTNLLDKDFGDSLFAFAAKYFKRIPIDYFKDSNGNFFKCAGDTAITYPIMYQGINYFHHLFIDNALMYDDIRPIEYNDDNLKSETGERLQEVCHKEFYTRFLKLVETGVIKTFE